MDDRTDPDRPDPSEMSRSDMQLVARAAGQGWDIPPAVRKRILQQAVNLLDEENPVGLRPTPSARTRLAAMQLVAKLDEINVKRELIAFHREKLEGRNKAEGSLADAVAEAERLAEERERERAG